MARKENLNVMKLLVKFAIYVCGIGPWSFWTKQKGSDEYHQLFCRKVKCKNENWETLTGIGILLSWKATSEMRNTSPMDAPLAWKHTKISIRKLANTSFMPHEQTRYLHSEERDWQIGVEINLKLLKQSLNVVGGQLLQGWRKLLIFYQLKESSSWILNKNGKSSKRIWFLEIIIEWLSNKLCCRAHTLKPPAVPAFMIRSGFKAWIEAYVTRDAEIVPTLSTSERIRFKLAKNKSWISYSCWVHVCPTTSMSVPFASMGTA